MCVCGGVCTFILSFFWGGWERGGGGGEGGDVVVNEVAVRFFACVHV